MRNYELAIIIEPSSDGEAATAVVDTVKQYITTVNGEIASTDVWGKRKLAYPIENYREGTYVLLNITLDPSTVTELERNLKLLETLVRYMLIAKEES